MKKAIFGLQILTGLIFVVFGFNGFFHFIPMPTPPEQALKYLMGLMAAPYFFPVLKGTEILAGFALLSNRFVPLALVVLAPIVLQVFLYHTLLDPSGAGMAILLMTLLLTLAWSRRENYRTVLAVQ